MYAVGGQRTESHEQRALQRLSTERGIQKGTLLCFVYQRGMQEGTCVAFLQTLEHIVPPGTLPEFTSE